MSKDGDFIAMLAQLPGASPRLQQQIKEAIALNDTVSGLINSSIADLRKLVDDAQKKIGLSDLNVVERDAAVKVLADMVKTTDNNYVDYQHKVDPAVFPPLDESNPLSMKARQTLMEQGAEKYRKDKQFHTTAELKNIGDRMVDMSSDEQLEFISGYTDNMSRENAVIALTELADTNPVLAFVGAGIASDPGYALTAMTILRGQQLLKNEGSRIKTVTARSETDVKSAIWSSIGGALSNQNLHPSHRAAVHSAALAIIASGAAGVETDARSAVNMALGGDNYGFGGLQTYNGKTFAAPVGVSADMIEDALDDIPGSITELSVDGSPPRVLHTNEVITGEMINNTGQLEKIGPDMYVVRRLSDGAVLQGAPGTPYTLHITRERLTALGVAPTSEPLVSSMSFSERHAWRLSQGEREDAPPPGGD